MYLNNLKEPRPQCVNTLTNTAFLPSPHQTHVPLPLAKGTRLRCRSWNINAGMENNRNMAANIALHNQLSLVWILYITNVTLLCGLQSLKFIISALQCGAVQSVHKPHHVRQILASFPPYCSPNDSTCSLSHSDRLSILHCTWFTCSVAEKVENFTKECAASVFKVTDLLRSRCLSRRTSVTLKMEAYVRPKRLWRS